MEEKIKIIITDDHKLFRKGLISLLELENMVCIGEAASGVELFKLLEVEKLNPDVILLDLEMDEMDGNVTLKKIRETRSHLKVIIVTSFSEGCLINDFKAKGANSFLSKDTDPKIIIETIKRVHYLGGYSNMSEKVKSIFTEGEVRVIPLILAGKKNKDIGKILGLATKTVEAYRSALYDKTGTGNGSEFSSYCTREGLEFLGQNLNFEYKKAKV